MRCHNCGYVHYRDGEQPCHDCGGAHRAMEICPERPGFFELWKQWLDGERHMMVWMTVGGTLIFLFIALFAVFATL